MWPARAEMGFLVLIFSACFTLVVAALLLPGPIWLLGRQEKASSRVLIIFIIIFFSALGIGFMLIEMSFIQMFTRFLGDPVIAAALVVGGLLFFAGAGSMAAPFLMKRLGCGLLIGPLSVSLAIILYMELLPGLFGVASFLSPLLKTGSGLLLLAPLAFLMGVPFPSGISALQARLSAGVPLAWAVNGFTSVISASGAVLLAMTIGFHNLLILAALAYVVAGAAALVPVWSANKTKEFSKNEA